MGRILAGKFEITGVIGAGSMGKVYRAQHSSLEKVVAIKVLGTSFGDPSLGARFKSEARAASRLDHPNSVQIFDFGEDEALGVLYIAMELLEGENLGDTLKREKRFSPGRAMSVLSDVLGALSAAHRSGVVHRDLKPANIMLVRRHDDDGQLVDFVKVCDFGIAKVLTVEGDAEATALALTRDGAVFGTPAFMSPEQARGEKVDARSDLFSCGVILYKMLSGSIPFRAQTAPEMLGKLISSPPDPILAHVPDLDPRISDFVSRALAKERHQRFQTAQEMRAALRELQGGRPSSSAPTGPLDSDLEGTRAMASMPPPPARTPAQAAAEGTLRLPRREASIPPASRRTIPPPSAPTEPRRGVLGLLAVAGLAAAGAGAWLFVRKRSDPLTQLQAHVTAGSYGIAETYFLEHYDELEGRAEALALAREALRMRRAAEDYVARSGLAFDPTQHLAPSVWRGETTFEGARRTDVFVLTIERVTEASFAGRLEWPDRQLASRVRGLHDGNHVVFWDDLLLSAPSRESRSYSLRNKINLMIVGEKMIATDARPPDKLEATRVR